MSFKGRLRVLAATFTVGAVTVLAGVPNAVAAAGPQVTVEDLVTTGAAPVVQTRTVAAADARAVIAALDATPGVADAAVAQSYQLTSVASPTDPGWYSQWNLPLIKAQQAWTSGTGTGQVVAVIDTGVADTPGDVCAQPGATTETSPSVYATEAAAANANNPNPYSGAFATSSACPNGVSADYQPDLAGQVLPGANFADGTGIDFHGTAVASDIAARLDDGNYIVGAAPGAKILPVRVCGDQSGCLTAWIAQGVIWAADHGATVENLSLAGTSYDPVLDAAVRYAESKGVAVVASAGNNGSSGNPVMYPAAFPGVIAVTGTGDGANNGSSAAGAATYWPQFENGPQVDLAAPGNEVPCDVPLGVAHDPTMPNLCMGTSFSSPEVSAAAALVRAAAPTLTPAQTLAVLMETATPEGAAPGRSSDYGAGVVNIAAAVAAAPAAARGFGLSASSSDSSVSLTWSAQPGATSYQVIEDGRTVATSTTNAAVIAGLTNDAETSFQVKALGTSSPSLSAAVVARPSAGPPSSPVISSVTQPSYDNASGTWSVVMGLSLSAGATGYSFYRDGQPVATYCVDADCATAPTTDPLYVSLPAAGPYSQSFTVVAFDNAGDTSTPSNVTVVGSGQASALGAPTGLSASTAGGVLSLSWTPVAGAVSYRVADESGTVLAVPQSDGVSLPGADLVQNHTYSVSALDEWGQASAAAQVAVAGTDPSAAAFGLGIPYTPGVSSITQQQDWQRGYYLRSGVTAGSLFTVDFTVANTGSASGAPLLYPLDGSVASDGSVTWPGPQTAPVAAGSWETFTSPAEIAAGSQIMVPVTFRVPSGTAPGTYEAGFALDGPTSSGPVSMQSQTVGRVEITVAATTPPTATPPTTTPTPAPVTPTPPPSPAPGTGLTGPGGTSIHSVGYRFVASDGGIFTFGDAPYAGSQGASTIPAPIVAMASGADQHGYWLAATNGSVYAHGTARFYGDLSGTHLAQPVVGMTATADGGGYWLVTADGGVYPFGDAHSYGDLRNIHLNKPVVGMTATADGGGYWLVATDGGIFSFGDAHFYGSTGNIHLNQPIVGMTASPDGRGYWFVASDGGIFSFGDAHFYGSTGSIRLNQPVVGMTATADGAGYWLVATDGGIFSFGDAHFYGSTGSIRLNQPIVGMAAVTS